jgi:signal peptidase I
VRAKRIGRWIGRVFVVLLAVFALAVTLFAVVSVDLVDKKDARLFGFTFHSVPADLRQKEFRTGDILLSSPVDTDTLQPGDIITFQSINPQHYGEVITHTIRDRVVYEGEPAFITYSSGGETEENDPYPVPADKVIGKYQFRLPGLGYFFQYLETTAGYITLIFLPYLVLILLIGTRYILFIRRRWYKRREAFASEEEDEDEEDREKRLRAEKMRDELRQLKEELDAQKAERRHKG